jgi:hypothetical protein
MTDTKKLRELNQAVSALKHLRSKGRVWMQTPEGKWCSVEFHEKYWLSRFSEEMRSAILAIAGPRYSKKK